MSNLAPIVIFVYNRIEHFKATIKSLQKNTLASQTELYIFSDGAKNEKDNNTVEIIREYIKSINNFRKVYQFFNKENKGLAQSVIDGVTQVLQEHEKIIVLEDDLLLSTNFISYMNQSLDYYQDVEKVFSVSAYCAPINITNNGEGVFFFRRINSWGWGTWKDRWESVDWQLKDFDDFIVDSEKRKKFNEGGNDLTTMLLKYKLGVINSWAIRFNYACFKQKKLNLYPVRSKVFNLGIDNSGTHTKRSKKFDTEIDHNPVKVECSVKEDEKIKKLYAKFYQPSFFRRIINYFKIKRYIFQNKNK